MHYWTSGPSRLTCDKGGIFFNEIPWSNSPIYSLTRTQQSMSCFPNTSYSTVLSGCTAFQLQGLVKVQRMISTAQQSPSVGNWVQCDTQTSSLAFSLHMHCFLHLQPRVKVEQVRIWETGSEDREGEMEVRKEYKQTKSLEMEVWRKRMKRKGNKKVFIWRRFWYTTEIEHAFDLCHCISSILLPFLYILFQSLC